MVSPFGIFSIHRDMKRKGIEVIYAVDPIAEHAGQQLRIAQQDDDEVCHQRGFGLGRRRASRGDSRSSRWSLSL
jgi:hypothetical protein